MTATLPGLQPPGLYRCEGWVVHVDEHGDRWVWAGDTLGTPGTRFGMRPVVDGRVCDLEELQGGMSDE